jgi:hypothetical protein
MYQLQLEQYGQPAQCIKRITDNAFIPFDPANTDFLQYQKWLSEGNVPLPPDEPTLPETV